MKSEVGSLSRIPRIGSSIAPGRRTLIVGITGDGYVPVVEDFVGDGGDIRSCGARSVIGLPGVVLGEAAKSGEPRSRAMEQLFRDFGYVADELIPMEGSRPPGILLAPLIKAAGWRARVGFVPGVYEVPLRRVSEWLWQRRLAGAMESPDLRRGLSLAQVYFPRWARARLCEAIGAMEARALVSTPGA